MPVIFADPERINSIFGIFERVHFAYPRGVGIYRGHIDIKPAEERAFKWEVAGILGHGAQGFATSKQLARARAKESVRRTVG